MHLLSALLCFISVQSYGMGWQQVREQLLNDIRVAQKSVVIKTEEFYDSDLAVALTLAHYRGCRVVVRVKKPLASTMRMISQFLSDPYDQQMTVVEIDGAMKRSFQAPLLAVLKNPPQIKSLKVARQHHKVSDTDTSRAYHYGDRRQGGRRRQIKRLPSVTIMQKAGSEETP